ncbi:tRNA (cytosine(38)-C(5))-methyltransferase [Sparassis crispa]|uniref:tRNA (cytosine(38)-C(5))-methyltransferase n=1 Tax=Sparassis crispa TaxID=139825 RepID=A0A401G941_9APHY|nr:tRNA (cytosine(38)-C(5))-methyltransferase [Sparassis crispa]GBE78684.1 tRNA (cytosine(38)-C(5))-methyltransferase [Sparassis crispa]
MAIRALEFYSGLGGLHRALSRSNVDGTVAGAFDWDQNACRVYRANYGTNVIHKVDISTLTASELRSYKTELWLLSPSCQPYTVLNPLAKGAADPRAKSFIHLVEDVLPELASYGAHPHYLLVENVAGFETSSTRQRLLTTLHSLNYAVLELLLTPLQFGIPNSRLRYYLLAKANFLTFAHVQGCEPKTWRHIPGHGHDWIDPRLQTEGIQETYFKVAKIRKFLDTDAPKGYMHPCAVPGHVLEKWGRLFDIVLPSSCRSCCFTRGYAKMAERSGSVLQMNEKLDTTNVFDRFLEAQSRGEKDAVRILDPLELRYFSPRELLRIFCFSPPAQEELQSDFIWPDDTSVKTQYRLIGNSVNVFVVTELINYLFE